MLRDTLKLNYEDDLTVVVRRRLDKSQVFKCQLHDLFLEKK